MCQVRRLPWYGNCCVRGVGGRLDFAVWGSNIVLEKITGRMKTKDFRGVSEEYKEKKQ
jgi:hypothetical protein